MDDKVVQRGAVEEPAPKKDEPQARTVVRKKSRRVGLLASLIILLIALGTMVVYGLMKRWAWTAALQLQTNQNIAGLTVAVVRPEKASAKNCRRSTWANRSVHPGANLRSNVWLSEEMVFRYRLSCERRGCIRRNRYAGRR